MVTLWGQSAGAVSVVLHMASEKSAGLFNKVITVSIAVSVLAIYCLPCRPS